VHLAEGPQLDGGAIAVILGVLLALLIAWIVAVVLAFKHAARAGRGSRNDAIAWAGFAVLELLPGVTFGPNVLLIPGLVMLAIQAVVYVLAKDDQ
jgi:hypothetical protein